jgi:hypothetical protein
MLRKIQHIMNVIIGVTIGLGLGNIIFTWVDYTQNPGLYEMQSVPWYTRIIAISIICLIALVMEIIVQCFVCCKIKKANSRID